MSIFRRIMLGGSIDITSLPETSKLYYEATFKVYPKSGSLGYPIIKNSWDSTTGKGIIACPRDISIIDENSFSVNDHLTSITIPNSVTSIGEGAFSYCRNLKSITIGNSVTTIGERAFFGCDSLTSVNIPDSVTKIGYSAFDYCGSLTSVTIPENVTSIGYYAFASCTSLTSVYCKATTPPVTQLSPSGAWDVFYGNASGCKIYVPIESVDAYKTADGWSQYADAIEGLGVSIQHIDGTFYTANDWTAKGFSNDEANGVAVNTEECKFVMAKVQFENIFWSSDSSNLVDGILTTTTRSIASTDLAGPANTALMLATDTSGAAYVCSNYTFPNGAKGYLPALGEWYNAYLYRQEVDNAMMLIGGHPIPKYDECWSSTQYDATTGWGMLWNSGRGSGVDKKDEFYEGAVVRAFTSL